MTLTPYALELLARKERREEMEALAGKAKVTVDATELKKLRADLENWRRQALDEDAACNAVKDELDAAKAEVEALKAELLALADQLNGIVFEHYCIDPAVIRGMVERARAHQ